MLGNISDIETLIKYECYNIKPTYEINLLLKHHGYFKTFFFENRLCLKDQHHVKDTEMFSPPRQGSEGTCWCGVVTCFGTSCEKAISHGKLCCNLIPDITKCTFGLSFRYYFFDTI